MEQFRHHLAENLVQAGWDVSHSTSVQLMTCFAADDRFSINADSIPSPRADASAVAAKRPRTRGRKLKTTSRFVGTLFVASILIGAAMSYYMHREVVDGEENALVNYYKEEDYMRCRYGCQAGPELTGPEFTECFNRCIADLTGVICDL